MHRMALARISWHDVQQLPDDSNRYEALDGELDASAAGAGRGLRASPCGQGPVAVLRNGPLAAQRWPIFNSLPCFLTSLYSYQHSPIAEVEMLVKKTSKNQITLPKQIVDRFPGVDHFVVTQSGNRIVLEPLEPSRADEVRARLKELEITEEDVAKAIAWAREREK